VVTAWKGKVATILAKFAKCDDAERDSNAARHTARMKAHELLDNSSLIRIFQLFFFK
jgi:hypothetical protein